jgi:serine O-acetyltransferase
MTRNPSIPPLAETQFSQHDETVRKLLTSYQNFGGLNPSESLNLPSKHAVGEICENLLQLLFPGFHDNDVVSESTIEGLTSKRLSDLVLRLEDQIRKSVRIGNPRQPTGKTKPIIQKFCKALHIVREVLRTDIEAAYRNDPSARSHEEIILSYPFIEAISIQRLAHRLYRAGAPMVPRMMTEWAHGRTGIDIHPGASIGAHFFIDHGTGVVIGETCNIGNHCKIYHGVTLGARSFMKDDSGQVIKGLKRHPNLGDYVTIYPNSTILGGGTVIGSNSTIGANVFLMHSIPPDTLVIYEEKNLSILSKIRHSQNDLSWSI